MLGLGAVIALLRSTDPSLARRGAPKLAQPVGWVEPLRNPSSCRRDWRWVSLRSTHPTDGATASATRPVAWCRRSNGRHRFERTSLTAALALEARCGHAIDGTVCRAPSVARMERQRKAGALIPAYPLRSNAGYGPLRSAEDRVAESANAVRRNTLSRLRPTSL